jgi:LPPG:FO 2-phospho-L-lactate transferase
MRFDGADEAQSAPGVLEAIAKAAAVVLCPSNPFISIGPILSVPGVREALRATAAPVLAVSPIVGGRAIKGPAARMMKTMGHRVSAAGIAELYQDFLDVLILDRVDAAQARGVEQLGIRAVVTNTVMTGLAQKKALARAVLRAAELL